MVFKAYMHYFILSIVTIVHKQVRKARLYPALISKPPPICRERERERERTVEEEEESSRPCVECEVPRELLLHRSELIPPPVLGFE